MVDGILYFSSIYVNEVNTILETPFSACTVVQHNTTKKYCLKN